MTYILDKKKIMELLAEKNLSPTTFAQKINLTAPALDRAMKGEEVYFATVVKIAKGLDVHISSLILAQVKRDRQPPSRPADYYKQLTENRYNAD